MQQFGLWNSGGGAFETEMTKQRQLMDKLVSLDGTASFTFPSASIGFNGGYGIHVDKKDVRSTVWASTGEGAICFPQYELLVQLHPGYI